ncbi:uncharacterized protein LOC126376928 [Pectinophora gossypiella]|uniref:uncharacterized protein LOC126376928 n=1 Tax=Pectinophora gossypiella TaxID=13191 RepID=UPI00214EE242|nr:uncharacterized protein LOC126376928 [Pectinophora gossypiella]
MLRNLLVLQILIAVFIGVTAEDSIIDEITEKPPMQPEVNPTEGQVNPLEDGIRSYELRAGAAEKSEQQGILPEEEVEKMYEDVIPPLGAIIELLKEPTNVYKFIEAKGIERVILPHLHVFNTDLRMQLLSLTMLLFNTAPTTTTVMAPVGLLDKLLDIFEEDDNLAIKARVVDILYVWLPDNPKIQARVMKLKGLEPFYDQVHKLDAGVIHTLLKLFNKILKEHLKARNEYQQKTKSDLVNLNMYKKIGLIERVSSKNVCHGLLNIFQAIWAYSYNNMEFMMPVFEILKNVEPYCLGYYRGKAKALELFQGLLQHMKQIGDDTKNIYENLGLNTTELAVVLNSYVDKLTIKLKDEF